MLPRDISETNMDGTANHRYIEVGDAEFNNVWEIRDYKFHTGHGTQLKTYYRRPIGNQCFALVMWHEPVVWDERYRWELEVYTTKDHQLLYKETILDDATGMRRGMALRKAHHSIYEWLTCDILDNCIL